MLGRIFHPENRFFQITARLVDLVLLSLLWLAASLPLVTLGPASAALYDTVVKTFRTKEETTPYRRFLRCSAGSSGWGYPLPSSFWLSGF